MPKVNFQPTFEKQDTALLQHALLVAEFAFTLAEKGNNLQAVLKAVADAHKKE